MLVWSAFKIPWRWLAGKGYWIGRLIWEPHRVKVKRRQTGYRQTYWTQWHGELMSSSTRTAVIPLARRNSAHDAVVRFETTQPWHG